MDDRLAILAVRDERAARTENRRDHAASPEIPTCVSRNTLRATGPSATTAPEQAKAQPQELILSPPALVLLVRSRATPNSNGPANEPRKPMQEWTAMVAPRYPSGATATYSGPQKLDRRLS